MSHRNDRAIFCKSCGLTVNPAQWSNVMGPHGNFKKAHGFNSRQAIKNTIWKLWPEKEDEDEEKEELYQFENGQSSEEDDEEESTSEDEGTDEELLKYETGLGKAFTENLKIILAQPDEEEKPISEKKFLELKNQLFNS